MCAAIVVAGAGAWLSGAARAQSVPAVPVGLWRTFANGDDVLALARESNGALWAGTRGGGLVRWDVASGKYRQYLRPQDPLAGNTVHDIAIDAAGHKWLATDGGLTVLHDGGTADTADDTWRSFTTANTFGGLPSNDVRAVAVIDGRIWVGTVQVSDPASGTWSGGGLAMLDTKNTPAALDDTWAPVATYAGTLRRLPDGSTKYGLVSDNILDLAVTPKGNLWVATAPHRSLEEQADPGAPKVWSRIHGGLSYRDTRATSDPLDDQWTGVPCDGIQFTVTCQVQTVAIDRAGNAWAGIGGRGVMYFRADDPNLIDEPSRRFDTSEGQGGNYVNAIAFGPAEDPALANTVWMATSCAGACTDRTGGLSVLNHRGTLFNRSDDEWDLGRGAPFTSADGLARDRAQAISIADGTAFLGTGAEDGVGGGISRLTLANQTFAPNLVTACGAPDCRVPASNFVADIAVGQPGTRWAGHVWAALGSRGAAARRFGHGVVDLDTRGTQSAGDDVWRPYSAVTTDPDGKAPWAGLAGDNVLAVAVQGDNVWFGSTQTVWNAPAKAYQDGGLAVFDGNRWTARTVENTRKGPTPGLRSNAVTSLAPGCAGDLWVGTGSPWDFSGAGVNVVKPGAGVHDLAADTWTVSTYPDLASHNVTDVFVDCAGGQAWVSGQHHITESVMGSPGGQWLGGGAAAQVLATGKWTRHDVSNGLQSYGKGSVKGEALAVLAGPGGRAWVGTYGTKDLDTPALVRQKPYWPAVLNAWSGAAWSNETFARAGWVSSLARDGDGRLWVATSYGGLAREAAEPELWRVERTGAGLHVWSGSAWTHLDMASAGLPANEVAVVAVAPDGDVWVGTDGWGLARLEVGAAPPTATPTLDIPSPTPTRTPRPTATETVEPTPTTGAGSPSVTPPTNQPRTATATATARNTRKPGAPAPVYLPYASQRRSSTVPTATPTRRNGGATATATRRVGPATATTTRTATRPGATPTPPGTGTPTADPSVTGEPAPFHVFMPYLRRPR